jgi:hypothetical protein
MPPAMSFGVFGDTVRRIPRQDAAGTALHERVALAGASHGRFVFALGT